jgi:hypothetical protein
MSARLRSSLSFLRAKGRAHRDVDRDVVEAFIGADAENAAHYTEYEWAPNGDRLDLNCDLPAKDFTWNSGMESAVSVDEAAHIWRAEIRIPIKALAKTGPRPGLAGGSIFSAMIRLPTGSSHSVRRSQVPSIPPSVLAGWNSLLSSIPYFVIDRRQSVLSNALFIQSVVRSARLPIKESQL